MRILGLDPALKSTGWGIIESKGNEIKYISGGLIITSEKMTISDRLFVIYEQLSQILEKYEIDECAIEEAFVSINYATALKLGQVRGAITIALRMKGIVINEYSARLIKKSITGKGTSDKQQMIKMIKILLPKVEFINSDIADALAVSICHVNGRKISKLF